MNAARRFAQGLQRGGLLGMTESLRVELFGSLGLTGRGHGTDKAVLLGLEGETPEQIDVGSIPARLEEIRARRELAGDGAERARRARAS